jgi:hypothetical protein
MQFALNADGTTGAFTATDNQVAFQVAGGFGGGTLKLQVLLQDGTTWQDVEGMSWTAGLITRNLTLWMKPTVRFSLSGATGPTLVGMIA